MKNTASPQTAILTIVSNNYLHFARTMMQSATAHHPAAKMYCVIVDADLSHAKALSSEFEAISVDSLNLPLGDEFFFQYSILELNTAVKPWAIEYLLNQGNDKVIYVDPDIHFYGPMVEIESALSDGMDIVLTPHLLAPIEDDLAPSELDIRRSGTYNLGFCSVRDSENTRRFLRWWQGKLTRSCVVDTKSGVFVDQSWIDLVPGLFEGVAILRHPGYNVAYWNLAQRPVTVADSGGYSAGDMPLVFFHFSGLDPFNPERFSKHQNRASLSTLGPAKALVKDYVASVLNNDAKKYFALPYGYGNFENGEKIPDAFRKLYRNSETVRQQMGLSPFDHPAVLNAAYTAIAVDGLLPSNAMVAAWQVREDLQIIFPLRDANSIRDYYHWFATDPTIADTFSSSVLEHHREIIEAFGAPNRTTTNASTASANDDYTHNARRIQLLYAYILGRAPDMEGLHFHIGLCNQPFGFLRAWKAIGLSQESKRKPALLNRLMKALVHSG